MPRLHLLHLLHPSRLLGRRVRRNRLATQLLLLAVLLSLLLPLASLYCIYKPPRMLMTYLRLKFPDVLFELPLREKEKLIALSLDDAPSQYTEEILSVLAEHRAHATFFVIGSQVPSRETLLRSIISQGHELANHAMHDEPSFSLSSDTLLTQLAQVKAMLQTAYAAEGKVLPNNYFRPGSGLFTRRMRDVLGKNGWRIVLGSVYPHDAQLKWEGVNAAHVLSMAREGAVVVCHDRRGWTPGMLRVVLPELGRRGFRVVTVTELVKSRERYPEVS